MPLKAILIDDEAGAIQTLTKLIGDNTEEVQVIATASSVEEGIKTVRANQPDVVFLDVKMSPGTGFDILEKLDEINFEIIFTTAYDRYALKAIKFSALDYLLKPISRSELKAAIEKVKKRKKMRESEDVSSPNLSVLKENMSGHFKRIALPTYKGTVAIELKDIIYLEANINYTVFHMVNHPQIVTSKTLKEYQEILSGQGFLRIRRSHLINFLHFKKYHSGRGGQVEMSDGSLLDVSRDLKTELLEKIRSLMDITQNKKQ